MKGKNQESPLYSLSHLPDLQHPRKILKTRFCLLKREQNIRHRRAATSVAQTQAIIAEHEKDLGLKDLFIQRHSIFQSSVL